MNITLECPKCRGAMERGFVLDNAHGGEKLVSQWVTGEPEESFWTGLKTKDRNVLPVSTYRCTACGYLESYA